MMFPLEQHMIAHDSTRRQKIILRDRGSWAYRPELSHDLALIFDSYQIRVNTGIVHKESQNVDPA